jgi:ribosome biogenesis GTPase
MLIQATITKSTGSWYLAYTDQGSWIQARTRGKLRLKEIDTSNPVAVGDQVMIEPDPNYESTGTITEILPRNNWIIRKANKSSSKRQILATNLDAAVLVASMISPRTSFGFIDRFLLCCQAFHVPAILFLNKTDLLGDYKDQFIYEFNQNYQNAEVLILSGSGLDVSSLETLNNAIQGKRILLAGHSGAGKSTLLNALIPDTQAKTAAVSTSHEKGKHTTTFAEMFSGKFNTQIIDTPGIRDFGVVDIPQEEIPHYFPEFRQVMKNCRFSNCTHTHEPECAVLDAVKNNIITENRYYSYISILNNEDIYK